MTLGHCTSPSQESREETVTYLNSTYHPTKKIRPNDDLKEKEGEREQEREREREREKKKVLA